MSVFDVFWSKVEIVGCGPKFLANPSFLFMMRILGVQRKTNGRDRFLGSRGLVLGRLYLGFSPYLLRVFLPKILRVIPLWMRGEFVILRVRVIISLSLISWAEIICCIISQLVDLFCLSSLVVFLVWALHVKILSPILSLIMFYMFSICLSSYTSLLLN